MVVHRVLHLELLLEVLLQLFPLLLDLTQAHLLLLQLELRAAVVILQSLLSQLRVAVYIGAVALVGGALSELQFEALDLQLQLPDDIRILRNMILHIENIPLHVRLNVLGPVRVLQSVVRVVVVRARRRNVRDHDGPAIAAQRVLQEPRQLRVTERDVIGLPLRVVLVQHVDAVSEGEE